MGSPPEARKAQYSTRLKVLILTLASALSVGSYYAFDTPSSLFAQLNERFGSDGKNGHKLMTFSLFFNMLYSAYSTPNIVLPFIGGHLVDTFGVRLCVVVFCLIVLIGQTVTAIGCVTNSMATMLAGRLIFGLGGENLNVAQSAIISAWFDDHEVAFALGLVLSLSRLGSVGSNWLSPVLATKLGVGASFWAGAFLCLCSMVTAITLAVFDYSYRKDPSDEESDEEKADNGPRQIPQDIRKLLFTKDTIYMRQQRRIGLFKDELMSAVTPVEHRRQPWFQGFNRLFWLLSVVCLLTYGAITPFTNIASGFLLANYLVPKSVPPSHVDCTQSPLPPNWTTYCHELDANRQRAGKLQSVPFLICTVLTPLIGWTIDHVGQRTAMIIAGPVLLIITHALFLLHNTSVLIPLIGLGVGYSVIVSVIWPCVPLAVRGFRGADLCGTGFGILSALQNIAMTLVPLGLAALYAWTHTQLAYEYAFIVIATLGLLVALWLTYEDEQHGAVLRKRRVTATPTTSNNNDVSDGINGRRNNGRHTPQRKDSSSGVGKKKKPVKKGGAYGSGGTGRAGGDSYYIRSMYPKATTTSVADGDGSGGGGGGHHPRGVRVPERQPLVGDSKASKYESTGHV